MATALRDRDVERWRAKVALAQRGGTARDVFTASQEALTALVAFVARDGDRAAADDLLRLAARTLDRVFDDYVGGN